MLKPAGTSIKLDPHTRKNVPWGIIEGYSALKAAAIVIVTAAVGTSFLQSIIIAIVSGTIGVIGMVLAAYIASKEAVRNRGEIRKLSEKIDVQEENKE